MKRILFNSIEGFKPTNLTLTVEEGAPVVWETMQTNDKGKVVFWRGEWEGETMHGMVSRQLGEGKNEDSYFSSTSHKKMDAAPVAEEAAVAPAAEETAAPAAEAADTMDEGAASEEQVTDTAAMSDEETAPAAEEAQPESDAKPKKKGWF